MKKQRLDLRKVPKCNEEELIKAFDAFPERLKSDDVDINEFKELMNKLPNSKFKIIESADPYSGWMGHSKEINVEWDILAAASDRCLAGRARGFIKADIIRSTPASVLWSLESHDLGSMGTFEVRKIRPGWSQIHFYGIGSMIGLSDDQAEIKKRHFQDVVTSYYDMLSNENIFIDNNLVETDQSATKEITLPPIYADTMRKVKELSEIPITIESIALRLAISTSTVKRYRRILGIRRRKK